MLWFPVLFGLVIAAILSVLFGVGFRRYGPWEGLVPFFLILVLASWVSALWAQPLGPPVMGFYWLPVFMLTLLVAVLLAATVPASRYRAEAERGPDASIPEEAERRIDFYFFVVLGLLLIMIVLGYWL